jgi:predicted enzyme related to lactoylglutathione lyase
MLELKIDYVEFNTPDIGASKSFAESAFGWSHIDYGPNYADIKNAGIGGGFDAMMEGDQIRPPLIVLKTNDLEAALNQIEAAGAQITKPIFSFPGGRRFQFKEPGGNELAVWTED